MNRNLVAILLAAAGAAAVGLAGCGDTCSTKAADVQAVADCPSGLKSNSQVTIQLQLCATCSDTNPTCTGEVVGNEIQLDASFHECQSNSSCPASACNNTTVTCTVNAPADGTYDIVTQNAGTTNRKTITVASSGATSCTL